MQRIWTLWALSLGETVDNTSSDAHTVAVIKTVLVVINLFCCFCIIYNTFVA